MPWARKRLLEEEVTTLRSCAFEHDFNLDKISKFPSIWSILQLCMISWFKLDQMQSSIIFSGVMACEAHSWPKVKLWLSALVDFVSDELEFAIFLM